MHALRLILCVFLLFAGSFINSPHTHASPTTKFGIEYALMHCRAKPAYDSTEAAAGRKPWGPIPALHWWGQPELGYYCLTEQPDVLKKHAEMLRDAGIDFVLLDVTNWDIYNADPNSISYIDIQQPFRKMVEVWSQVQGAPKIVPWVIVNNVHMSSTSYPMVKFIEAQLDRFPSLYFHYQGKPLLVVYNISNNQNLIQSLSQKFMIRQMEVNLATTHPNIWTFLQYCNPSQSFISSHGSIPCNQNISRTTSGQIEQISVTSAYQTSYMSDVATSAGKFDGKTFRRQFETVFANPNAPIVTIISWNEMVAHRYCPLPNGTAAVTGCASEFLPNGYPIFVDQFNQEYNRDIEPQKGGKEDYYYHLMKEAISLYKRNKNCTTEPSNLFCVDYAANWRSSLISPGDLTRDRRVDIFDYNLLVTNFGNPYTLFDYNALVSNFGK